MSDNREATIEALLRKAQGTDNENEASAFYAKAQELMVKWAIDDAAIRAAMAHKDKPEEVTLVRFPYSAGPLQGYAQLLFVVSKAQGARAIVHTDKSDMHYASIVGYKSDIDHTIVLYVSLMTQEVPLAQVAYADWAKRSQSPYGRSRRPNWVPFHTSHLQGFAERIGERLIATRERVVRENDASALMVMRDKEVRDCIAEHFPYLGHLGTRTSSYAGFAAGRANGDRVDVGATRIASRRLIGG